MVSEELNCLDSPDQACFYTSGKTTNEPAFLLQLFARQFGTNTLPDCSNMCHESSGVARVEALGVGKGTATPEGKPPANVDVAAEGQGSGREDHCGQSAS